MLPAKDNIMTTNSSIKKAIRLRMAETGEPYMVARRALSNSGNSFSRPKKGKVISVIGLNSPSDTAVFSILLGAAFEKLTAQSGEPFRVLIIEQDHLNYFVPSISKVPAPYLIDPNKKLPRSSVFNFDVVSAADNNIDRSVLAVLKNKYDIIILNTVMETYVRSRDFASTIADQIILLTPPSIMTYKNMVKQTVLRLTSSYLEYGLSVPVSKIGVVVNRVMSKNDIFDEELTQASLGAQYLGQTVENNETILAHINNDSIQVILDDPGSQSAYYGIVECCLENINTQSLNQGEVKMSSNKFVIGYEDNGTEVIWEPSRNGNLFIGGLSGSGKTSLIDTIMEQAFMAPNCEVAYVDVKKVHSSEYEKNIPKSWIAVEVKDAFLLIKDIVKRVEGRLRALEAEGVGNFQDLKVVEPYVILVIDELYPLLNPEILSDYDMVNSYDKKQLVELLTLIMTTSYRTGVYVVAATQKPEDENIARTIWEHFDTRVALNGMSESMSQKILSGFAEASTLPYVPEEQGLGYRLFANTLTRFRTTIM